MRRNKKIPHDCERSHTGYVLREHNKDMLILTQRNRFDKGGSEKMTPKDLKNRLLDIIGILDAMSDDVKVIQAMAVVKPVGQGHILIHEGLDSAAASLGVEPHKVIDSGLHLSKRITMDGFELIQYV